MDQVLAQQIRADNALVERAQRILKEVRFFGVNNGGGDYEFEVRKGHGGVHLRARYYDADIYTRVRELQLTRKWFLSPEMTDSEIVQTAFKCCWTSFEHRCREAFTYKGRRIFGPHFDVDDLWRLCEHREDAGSRNPVQHEPRRIDP